MKAENVISIIENNESISVGESFSFARAVSILLRENESMGRKIIIHALDNWEKMPSETIEIWTDLIESAGFYPYLEKEKGRLKFNNLAGEIRKGRHHSNYINKYFHEEQKFLQEILNSNKNLIVSAPTSFGKSLLIEEIVASKKYKNIVVIQPTLALLDETRKKLKKYSDNYKIIVRTTQESSPTKGNLFLLTSERVLEYKRFPLIDFLIIDEFYKLSTSRNDDRADHLNNAFYFLLKKFNPKFYLLGPNIDGISEGFAKKYNAVFYKTDYSLIDNKIIDIYSEYKDKFDKPRTYKDFKEGVLFDLLFELKGEQTIIYCSSPDRVRQLAMRFSQYLANKGISEINDLPLIKWIEVNIDPQWNLIRFLKFQIGINDGGLQKHINASMIKYFNDNKLKYMFCTSTIIEGVNTSAKNVVIFDSKKGSITHLDYFDHSNIKGRSGRMMVHYIGKVYDFNKPPKKENVTVDIPFFEQSHDPSKFSPEIEIGIDDSDIKNKTREQYKELQQIPVVEREIIKSNGVLVKGQQNMLFNISELDKKVCITRPIRKYSKYYLIHELLRWTKTPTYDQLQFVLEMCWNNLIKKGESVGSMTLPKLVQMTFNYGIKKDVFALIQDCFIYNRPLKRNINKTDEEVLNQSIQEVFQVLRHWFQYKVPKWLSVMNELQKYVCEKNGISPGNYSFYANQIENDFIQDNLSILSEYGIPKSAIEKIGKDVEGDIGEEDVVKRAIEFSRKNNNGLLEYEIEKINDVL